MTTSAGSTSWAGSWPRRCVWLAKHGPFWLLAFSCLPARLAVLPSGRLFL
jgi:hypothetical protein